MFKEETPSDRRVVPFFPKISITPHLEVLDHYQTGTNSEIGMNDIMLAFDFASKIAKKLQSVADIVEVIKVNFYQNVSGNEELMMQISIIIAPLLVEKKIAVEKHICIERTGIRQGVNVYAFIKEIEEKLEQACREKQIQLKGSVNKLAGLITAVTM